ncbi:eIF-2-alpha kinase GCN2 isoform X3 [Histomonas meleagridis]|uniref:eIF-2-alpha kinase GCN2 isoform X3 n=1 Tax=Histomonas meleagridis TaxID=135588 RepID=UPI003559E153|nr:eIF-2-alpha kinase GCN2 isoform X3 [Histomonas meleagridis]KAH0805921.1 eIF-2-alpha kinase GCN2 isoform X3 [Histomonas meleagridis]
MIKWDKEKIVAEEVHFPDPIETSKLFVETSLNRNRSDEWIRERTNLFAPSTIGQSANLQNSFLIYCLFRACSGKQSLEECANFLINELHIIAQPGPPIESIPTTVSKLLSECKTLPSSVRELLDESPKIFSSSQMSSFFNDFSIISLCNKSTVRARNRVDRRVYAIKVIPINDQIAALQSQIALLTQLQHRYIVRYYNSWVDECDEEAALSISKAFCLSPPITKSTKFMFMQMDYIDGKSLKTHLQDPQFFESHGIQWRITQQILEALHYLHSHDIVYNMMTPSNIFIEGEDAKLTDFSESSSRLQFPYNDSREIIDPKSDMFAFGIVFFEMWHPFENDHEREVILRDLVYKGIIPKKWSEIFPIQSKIVSLLMQPANKRPSAIDLLQAKLVPSIEIQKDGSDLRTLTNAISAGTITLDSHAPEVLSALFADSRRMPFGLSDFDGMNTSDIYMNKFESHAITEFYNIATTFGGFYFSNTTFQCNSHDEMGIIVMLDDGSLHSLPSSVTKPFHYWIQKNGFRSLRTYSKRNVFHLSRRFGTIIEDEILSYDITSPERKKDDYFEALDLAFAYFSRLLPNTTEKLKIVICHGGVLKELSKPESKSLSTKIQYITYEQLKSIVESTKGKLHDSLQEILTIVQYIRYIDTYQWRIEVRQPKRNIGNSLMVKIRTNNVDLAYIGTVNTRSNKANETTIDKNPTITSVHIPLKSLTFCYENGICSFGIQIEVQIVIVCSRVLPNQALDKFSREICPQKYWNRAFAVLQKVAVAMRKEKIVVSFAPNDGNSYLDGNNQTFAKIINILAFVDERDKSNLTLVPSKLVMQDEINKVKDVITKIKSVTIIANKST